MIYFLIYFLLKRVFEDKHIKMIIYRSVYFNSSFMITISYYKKLLTTYLKLLIILDEKINLLKKLFF